MACPFCGNRTSLYAVLHRCTACGILLESPSPQLGHQTVCPRCTAEVVVPRDVLEAEAFDPTDDSWFGFQCPHCNEELVGNKQDVGVLAVCVHCLVPLKVPMWGHHLQAAVHKHTLSSVEAVQASTERRCPHCQTLIPTHCSICPVCRQDNA
jgi:hypothetical protein